MHEEIHVKKVGFLQKLIVEDRTTDKEFFM